MHILMSTGVGEPCVAFVQPLGTLKLTRSLLLITNLKKMSGQREKNEINLRSSKLGVSEMNLSFTRRQN